jgi:hypothetical protein
VSSKGESSAGLRKQHAYVHNGLNYINCVLQSVFQRVQSSPNVVQGEKRLWSIVCLLAWGSLVSPDLGAEQADDAASRCEGDLDAGSFSAYNGVSDRGGRPDPSEQTRRCPATTPAQSSQTISTPHACRPVSRTRAADAGWGALPQPPQPRRRAPSPVAAASPLHQPSFDAAAPTPAPSSNPVSTTRLQQPTRSHSANLSPPLTKRARTRPPIFSTHSKRRKRPAGLPPLQISVNH